MAFQDADEVKVLRNELRGANELAKQAFSLLHPALDPYVFFAAVPSTPNSGREAWIIEPQAGRDLVPGGHIREFIAREEHTRVFRGWSNPSPGFVHFPQLEDYYLLLLAKFAALAPSRIAYRSLSLRIPRGRGAENELQFMAVLLLLSEPVAAVPEIAGEGGREPASLRGETASELLFDVQRALSAQLHGLLFRIRASAEEIVRLGATRFMQVPAQLAAGRADNRSLFTNLSTIAGLPYEGSEPRGRLLLCRRDTADLVLPIALKVAVPLASHRQIRKLLEAVTDELSLVADGHEVVGLGRLTSTVEFKAGRAFEVDFLGRSAWDLRVDGRPAMHVRSGQASLPMPSRQTDAVRAAFASTFVSGDVVDLERAVKLVEAAIAQRHGTLLVFSSDAAAETRRLGGQAHPIAPTELTPALLAGLTAVDGAVLLAPDGTAHGFGAVLDGLAVPGGDPGRGSRFNSALRYVASRPDDRLVVVIVSDDGMVTVRPGL
jgi:hypothetical protein